MRKSLYLLVLLIGLPAHAYLTSDVTGLGGYSSINMKSEGNSINLTSLTTVALNYSLNNAAWNTSLNIDMEEAVSSSQGNMAWTRLGFSVKYYMTGFNAQRVIFDNKVEGVYWRPAPYIGLGTGISTLSLSSIGGATGSLNASVLDVSIKAGAEVLLMSNWFLVGQLQGLQSLSAQSSRSDLAITYQAICVYMGLKIASY